MRELTVDQRDGALSRRRTRPSVRRHSDRHRVVPEGLQAVQRYRGDAPSQPQRRGQLAAATTLHLVGVEVRERRGPGAGEGGGGLREAVDGPRRRRTCRRHGDSLQLVDRKQHITQEEEPSFVSDHWTLILSNLRGEEPGRPYKTVHDPVLISEVLLPPAGVQSRTSSSLSH